MPKEEIVTVVFASVSDDSSGIHLRTVTESGEFRICFIPSHVWGKIPPGKNPKKELEKIANILNGYKEKNGNWEPIENFQPKKIKLVKE